jgi:hypothetical protein
MPRAHPRRFLYLCSALTFTSTAVLAHAQEYTAIVVCSDSLSGTGNVAAYAVLPKTRPRSQEVSFYRPTGRPVRGRLSFLTAHPQDRPRQQDHGHGAGPGGWTKSRSCVADRTRAPRRKDQQETEAKGGVSPPAPLVPTCATALRASTADARKRAGCHHLSSMASIPRFRLWTSSAPWLL